MIPLTTEQGFPWHADTLRLMLIDAPQTDVGEWQSMDIKGNPLLITHELEGVILEMVIPASDVGLERVVIPNMPWAEDHFQERVSGQPLNPGFQYQNWPYYKGNVEKHQTQADAAFSHTYMERFWPKQAGGTITKHRGIRFEYGDLMSVVRMLNNSLYTRQAYLPVWFPEDTGAEHGERVPCTLGYHFLVRNRPGYAFPFLNMHYYIRSCDYLRHFRDDVYLAGRLMQWVTQKLRTRGASGLTVGTLTMHISSLHVFAGDMPRMRGEIG